MLVDTSPFNISIVKVETKDKHPLFATGAVVKKYKAKITNESYKIMVSNKRNYSCMYLRLIIVHNCNINRHRTNIEE